jgi:hypothetical protein
MQIKPLIARKLTAPRSFYLDLWAIAQLVRNIRLICTVADAQYQPQRAE